MESLMLATLILIMNWQKKYSTVVIPNFSNNICMRKSTLMVIILEQKYAPVRDNGMQSIKSMCDINKIFKIQH